MATLMKKDVWSEEIEFEKNIAIKTQEIDGDINKNEVWNDENRVCQKYTSKNSTSTWDH